MSSHISSEQLNHGAGYTRKERSSRFKVEQGIYISVIKSLEHLSLDKTLSSGQTFRWTKTEDNRWMGFIEGCRFLLRQLNPADSSLRLECRTSPGVDVKSKIGNYFNLDDKYEEIVKSLNADPLVDSAMSANKGLRLLSQEPWETLISFILSSASNIPRIRGNIKRLCNAYGAPETDVFGEYHGFPIPETLAQAATSDFERLGFGYRAEYVWKTALRIAEEPKFLPNLQTLPYEDAKRELCTLHGVGEKIADCVLLFSLGFTESFPVDTWIKKVISENYFEGKSLSVKKIAEFGREKFGKHAGYVQQCLFEYVRNGKSEAAAS